MNLPNYFLADLPPEATLTPSMITEACQTLRRNREAYLATRSTQSLIELLNRIESMSPARRASGEESADMVVPAMKVDGFHFTEVTRF